MYTAPQVNYYAGPLTVSATWARELPLALRFVPRQMYVLKQSR